MLTGFLIAFRVHCSLLLRGETKRIRYAFGISNAFEGKLEDLIIPRVPFNRTVVPGVKLQLAFFILYELTRFSKCVYRYDINHKILEIALNDLR